MSSNPDVFRFGTREHLKKYYKTQCNLNIQLNYGSIENNSEHNKIIESNMGWQDISKW